MEVKILLENTSKDASLIAKHGLSMYIEKNGIKTIFDTGPDDTFIKNANKMNIDISKVDYLIISHGHIDHGGGIKAFLEHNSKGRVIISKHAFSKYYTKFLGMIKIKIGLDDTIDSSRFDYVDDSYEIEGFGYVFSNVTGSKLVPSMNDSLLVKIEKSYVKDDFKHEISLLIKEKTKKILISGCSHKGIINIADEVMTREGAYPDVVFAGMHLFNPVIKKYEKDSFITDVANGLKSLGSRYYTYHCTGEYAYDVLKQTLKDDLNYLSTGESVVL